MAGMMLRTLRRLHGPMVSAMLVLSAGACSHGTDDASPADDPIALVTVGRAEAGTVRHMITLYGSTEAGPEGSAALVAPAEAIVARIVAPVGTRVSPGQTVASLVAGPTTRVDIAKAAADAGLTQAAFARARRLRADGLVGDAEVETARAAAAAASAVNRGLTSRAGALTLRAPAAGFVQTVANGPGELVQQGAVVATIARLGNLRARFGIDPAAARALRPGMPVTITTGAGHAGFTVAIASIDPVVDPQTRLAAVFVKLPADSGLAGGQALTATVADDSGGGGTTVPYAALLDDGGQPFVFVVTGGVAHRRDVVVGVSEGDRVAILKGVGQGEQVVTAGGTAIEDGMKVRTR